jgi:lipopolysaccharide assembly outer membrane protein LptD (OstA)
MVICVAFLANASASLSAPTKESKLPPEVVTQHHGPVDITGDRSIYDSKNDSFTVIGHAVMTQGGTVLTADQITVMRREHRAIAIGHVHITDPEVEVWASEGEINLANETLELQNGKVLAKRNTYHLEGKRIRKLEGQKYVVLKGFFTTCGCEAGTPDWSFSADRMDVTMGQKGTAKNPTFTVLGYPLIPLPYAEFPADTTRHSGFLSGREGESGLRGFQYLQPYYLDIDKSSDATFAFDAETSERIGGLGEYRLTNGPDDYFWVNTAYYNESIRSDANRAQDIVDNQIADTNIPVNRYGIIGMTREHITPDLMFYGSGTSTSDDLYLREMDVWTLSRGYGNNFGSERNAQSRFGLLDEFDDGFARVQGTWNQDLIQSQPFALQQLPDAWVDGRRELPGNFAYLDYDLDAANFWRQKGLSGVRLSMNPRVTAPWRIGDYVTGYFTGGLWANAYDASGHDLKVIPVGQNAPFLIDGKLQNQKLIYNNFLEQGALAQGGANARWIPYFQTGASTELERIYDVNWKYIDKLKNTIEPFVSYDYVPDISQSAVPLWDERDRINARSLIVYGFTSRLYGKMNATATTPEVPENVEGESAAVQSADSGQGPGLGNAADQEAVPDTTGATESHGVNGQTTRELFSMTLMQAYDTTYAVQPNQVALSDIEGKFTLYPSSVVSFGSNLAYDPRSHPGISLASIQMNVQPPWNANNKPSLYMGKALTGSFMQLSYNYVRSANTVEFVGTSRNASQYFSARVYSDLFDRLGVYLAPDYDIAASRMLSMEYGFRIKSPCNCWAVDVGITNSYNPNEVSYQVQATLGGLGSFGQSPFGRNPFALMGLAGQPTGVLPSY